MRRSHVLTGMGVVLATLALLTSTAMAAPITTNDPKGDGVGPGDLRAQRLSQQADVLQLRVRTEKPLNLDSAPAWHRAGSATSLRFTVDTRASTPGPDYAVILHAQPGEISTAFVGLVEATPRDGCIPTLQTQEQQTVIEVAMGVNCFEGAFIRSAARYRLDQGGNGTIDSGDRAPNTGYSAKLVPVA